MLHSFSLSKRRYGFQLLFVMCWIVAWQIPHTGQAVELYRCTLNGSVEFRQTPCPAGEQEKTRVIEQSRGMSPAKPALKIIEKTAIPRKTKSAKVAQNRADAERCWKMEKKLEKVEQTLRSGYKPSQFQRLHQKQDEYEEYLQLFCP